MSARLAIRRPLRPAEVLTWQNYARQCADLARRDVERAAAIPTGRLRDVRARMAVSRQLEAAQAYAIARSGAPVTSQ